MAFHENKAFITTDNCLIVFTGKGVNCRLQTLVISCQLIWHIFKKSPHLCKCEMVYLFNCANSIVLYSKGPDTVQTSITLPVHIRNNAIWGISQMITLALRWRHDKRDSVSNHRRLDYLLNPLFRRRSNKASKLRVTGLCEGNPPVSGEFSSQRASKAENVSIWWHHHGVNWAPLIAPFEQHFVSITHITGNRLIPLTKGR